MPSGLPSSLRSLRDVLVFAVCLILFVHFDMGNYRGADHYLGRTMPSWQEAIVAGTAPAPYVYRQGVPQLRRLAMTILPPGHAAVAVDTVFAVLALLAGGALGGLTQGQRGRSIGLIVTTLALLAVFPNDKAESVAMVAAVLWMAVFVLEERSGLAAAIAIASVVIRPELPILFGFAGLAASLSSSERRLVGASLLSLLIGTGYLALAKFYWWPNATYPTGAPAFTLPWNVTHVFGSPGLALNVLVLILGIRWILQGRLLLGWFVTAWVVAITTLGMAWEFRLLAPMLPLCFFLEMPAESSTESPLRPRSKAT